MDLSVFRRSSKLKWDRVTILLVVFLAISFLYIPVLIWEGEKFGTNYSSLVWGGVIILFGLIYLFMVYIPMRNIKAIVFLLYLVVGTMPWHYHLKKLEAAFFTDRTYNIHLIVFLVVAATSIPYLFHIKRKIMVHFRKLFELAAGPLEEAGDGFTGRPYPVGKWKYSMEEINQFSQFLHRNMIAFPRYYENRILLSFSAKMVDPRKQDPEKSSFIAFDQKGNIAVNISKADYDQYKDRFTFDQLCQSLSLVFKDFFDKFRTGRKEEIVSIMEAFEPKWVKPVQIGTLILLSLTFLIIFIIYLVGK